MKEVEETIGMRSDPHRHSMAGAGIDSKISVGAFLLHCNIGA